MKKLTAILPVVFFLVLTGCNKPAELIQPLAPESGKTAAASNPNTTAGYSLTSFQFNKSTLHWEGQILHIYSLEWKATGEASFLAGYEVQYSANNNSFVTIATVAPANTNVSTTHGSPVADYGYYRLKINLLNGTVQYSSVLHYH